MIALFLAPFALLTTLLTLLRLHLGIANEDGSHDPSTPFVIDDPTLAQAIYGRLSAAAPFAYYAWSVAEAVGVRAMLLIPENEYQSGFRAHIVLFGPGFPPEGVTPAMHLAPLTIAGRTYRLIQTHVPPLPAPGAIGLTFVAMWGAVCTVSASARVKPGMPTLPCARGSRVCSRGRDGSAV